MFSKLRIAGISILFCAFFLSFLVSISLPTIRTLDFVRVTFDASFSKDSEVRLGIWSFCGILPSGDHICNPTGHGYGGPDDPIFGWFNLDKQSSGFVILNPSWTRGLAIHPVATAFAFVAFGLVFTKRTLATVLLTALGALLTLLAYAVDIALYAEMHHLVSNIPDNNDSINTHAGPGFWLTLVSLILLIVAGVVNLISHRSDSYGDYPSYPMSDAKSWQFWKK